MASDLSDAERRMLFGKGFGDGAKLSVAKHKEHSDYIMGWHAGRYARTLAAREYCEEKGLPMASPLHGLAEGRGLI